MRSDCRHRRIHALLSASIHVDMRTLDCKRLSYRKPDPCGRSRYQRNLSSQFQIHIALHNKCDFPCSELVRVETVRTPTIMARPARPFSGQTCAEYLRQIRSRNHNHFQFLPATTHCMHRLSKCCVVPAAMCCTVRQPRTPRCTSAVVAEGCPHFGHTLQSFAI